MASTDAHGGYASENVANVFTDTDQRKQATCLSPQSRALALGQSAPYAVTLAVRERVLETIETHLAVDTHALCGVSRAPALREEQIGIRAAAECARLPVIPNFPHARAP